MRGALLIDGTFWSEHELAELGTGAPASAMGHLPVGGPVAAWIRGLPAPRKIYIHINNTNPILIDGSPEPGGRGPRGRGWQGRARVRGLKLGSGAARGGKDRGGRL